MDAMVREFRCPACQATISAVPEQFGQTVRCGFCQEQFELADGLALTVPPPIAQPAGGSVRRFNFQCLRCGSILEGRSDLSGEQGQCPTCAALFTIPEVHPVTGLAVGLATTSEDGENPTPMHAYAAAGDKAPQIVPGEDGEKQIHCPRCNGRSPIDANNCLRCGLPFTIEGASFESSSSANTLAVASLTLGIMAVPSAFCYIGGGVGVVAIALGLLAFRRMNVSQSGQDRGKRTAAAGIALGTVAFLITLAISSNLW